LINNATKEQVMLPLFSNAPLKIMVAAKAGFLAFTHSLQTFPTDVSGMF
jgi:hypothetical protein